MQIELCGISKRFGDVQALDGVDLDISPGEVLALLGENGAGKSTLMKVLLGIHSPDSGEIRVDGALTEIRDPKQATRCGIGMVFQNFNLFPALSVRDNLRLAKPALGWWLRSGDTATAEDHLSTLAPGVDLSRPVYSLTVGECQMVELAKVLSSGARVVILDEPTSVLLPSEIERLYDFIRELKAGGRAVVLISHKMADVDAVADRIVVMRRGKVVDRALVDARSVDDLVRGMVGEADISELQQLPPAGEVPFLQVRSMRAPGLQDIGFEVRRGEVLGIAGVSGNGQKALADAVAGVLPISQGDIVLDGISIARQPDGRPDSRVAYLPEAPRQNAVAEGLSNTLNLLLRRLPAMPRLPNWNREGMGAEGLLAKFDVRPPLPAMLTGQLSGGNLQKLVIARELSGQPDLIVACYPTMGLDIAACHAVYSNLFDHARRGAAVVWFSEELDDLQRYAHRIAVMNAGEIAGILDHGEATRQRLGQLMAVQKAGRRLMPVKQAYAILVVVGGTFVAAVVFFMALGKPPITMIGAMLQYSFGDAYSLSETLVKATPILFCAMATIIPARLGLISVGADGQLYMGALVAAGVMIAAHDAGLGWLLFPLVGIAAIVGGAVWGLVPAYLKARIGVHETISTLLLNYIALLMVNYVVYGPWKDTGSLGWPATISFPAEAALPTLFGTRVNLGFVIAIVIAVLAHWYLSRSRLGVELRVLRENRALGTVIGLNYGRAALLTMAVGGALAGLAGWEEASSVQGRLQPGLSLGYGLTGFLVGWLSGHNLIWAVVLSVLIGGLYSAGDALQDIARVPAASAMVLQGILFVVALSVSGWGKLRAARND